MKILLGHFTSPLVKVSVQLPSNMAGAWVWHPGVGGRTAADGWTGGQRRMGGRADGQMGGQTENENKGVQHVGVGSCQNAMGDGSASRIQGRETERKMEGRRRGEKKEEDRRKMEEKAGLRDWGPNVLGCQVPGAQIDE